LERKPNKNILRRFAVKRCRRCTTPFYIFLYSQKIGLLVIFLLLRLACGWFAGCRKADVIRTFGEAMTDVLTAIAVGKVPCRFDVDKVL